MIGYECPDCGSHKVATTTESFKWCDHVKYTAPVRRCECGFSWCDSEKEDAEVAAIKAAGYSVDERGRVFIYRGRLKNNGY